jgi:hypothetical protein
MEGSCVIAVDTRPVASGLLLLLLKLLLLLLLLLKLLLPLCHCCQRTLWRSA